MLSPKTRMQVDLATGGKTLYERLSIFHSKLPSDDEVRTMMMMLVRLLVLLLVLLLLVLTRSPPQVHAYATRVLQMKLDESDAEFLWLAKEALVAPLPLEWRECVTAKGRPYYMKIGHGDGGTGGGTDDGGSGRQQLKVETQWAHPMQGEYWLLVRSSF